MTSTAAKFYFGLLFVASYSCIQKTLVSPLYPNQALQAGDSKAETGDRSRHAHYHHHRLLEGLQP